MASVQLSPGVQVIEKDYTQIAPSLSTTTGAFAGVFKWGPVLEPVLVSSESDLVSVFGQPNDSNYESFFVAKNFLEYSNRMYVARVDSASGRNAVAKPSGSISGINVVLSGSGYTSVPSVSIEAPSMTDGVAATAVAQLSGGPIASYTIISGGSGYSVGDIITFSNPEVSIDTIVNGEVQSSSLVVAKAKVSAVNPSTSAITTITFVGTGLTYGDGYIDANSIDATILNSSESAPSSGTGANISFTVQPSSIKAIEIVESGSGYTTDQLPLSITIASPSSGITATASATIEVAGAKIRNELHYSTNWSEGQGSYGEFAAKYIGSLGNSLLVSMCDGSNWSTGVNGIFHSRKSIESKENARELSQVRRILDNEDTFSNEAIDAGKILRTTEGQIIGEVKGIVNKTFKKITLSKNTAYNVEIDQHVYREGYGSSVSVASVSRNSNGVATITTVGNHGLVAGQRVTIALTSVDTAQVSAKAPKFNKQNAEILSATNTTFTYQTEVFSSIGSRTAVGTVLSTSMGQIDGFVRVFNSKTDSYELSSKQFIVTEFNSSEGNGWISGARLLDTRGVVIGLISEVEDVQTIELTSTALANVDGKPAVSEWKYKSAFSGEAPSSSAYALRNNSGNDELHVVVIDADGKITGEAGSIIEKFEDLSKASDAKSLTSGASIYYKDVINNNSSWIWVLDHTREIEVAANKADFGQSASVTGKVFKSMSNAVTRRLSYGADTTESTQGNILDAYEMFDDSAKYDVSLMPLGHLPASTVSTIVQEVVEKRKDCIAFASAPLKIGTSNSIVADIVEYRDSLPSSSYIALDSGWKYQYDKYADKFRWIPASGDVAGLCAYTEQVADAWFSPGGFNRGQIKNAIKLAFNPSQAQRDELYVNGINPIVTFPGEGTVLFGDKTLLKKDTAFNRINVRRLFIVLEKTVSIASKYQLFEFNDDFTRSQFKGIVEPFLRDVQGRRGITDFLVKCDTSNNTPTIIDANEFIADIYIKPARSINFIKLNFIATKTGVSFEEVGA